MKPSQLSSLLIKLLPANEPVLVQGSPGLGKTDTIQKATEKLGYDLIVTHPVVSDPTDFKGMPAIVKRGEGKDAIPGAEFLPFGDLNQMIEATVPTVVFLDDIGQAPPAVQAALMQLVLARKVNNHAISDQVRFIAATNRRQDKAAVSGLITPLLDRFSTVITMEFDLDDWVNWGIQNGMPAELLAFARFKPDLMGKFEASKDMKKSTTPRSVASFGRLVNLGIEDHEVLGGAAGEGFATEFLAFQRTWRELPDREEIYRDPTGVPVPTKIDVLYALMGSLAFGANEKTFAPTVKFLERVKAEFQVLCIKDALSRTPTLKSVPAFAKWAIANKAVFGYDNA